MTETGLPPSVRRPRGTFALTVIGLFFTVAFCGFIALGCWQVYRLSWKLELIERVESRIHAPAVPLPSVVDWSQVSIARDEYRHVVLDGRFLANKDTRVQAVTTLGPGYWILSPFEQRDGTVVLVNRGFIPADWHGPIPVAAADHVVGLLRRSEPRGGFLRHNDPIAERWYSRDVAAIGAARGLSKLAPFFVDAEAQGFVDTEAQGFVDTEKTGKEGEWPRPGLTVTVFPNNHLGYALTWFALAAMVLWGAWRVLREERTLRRR